MGRGVGDERRFHPKGVCSLSLSVSLSKVLSVAFSLLLSYLFFSTPFRPSTSNLSHKSVIIVLISI